MMADHLGYSENEENEDEEQNRVTVAINQTLQTLKASQKRKRDALEHDTNPPGSKRSSSSNVFNGNGHDPGLFPDSSNNTHDFNSLNEQIARHVASGNNGLPNSTNASSTAAAALAGIMPQLTVPQPTELSFASTASAADIDRQLDSSFDLGPQDGSQNHHAQGAPYNLTPFTGQGTAAQVQAAREASNGGSKPAVGTDEWHKVRRDNHKEVERRRRETINEGINELAKIVPGCEKNKGSILQQAVRYITELKDNETNNINKWTLDKLVNDQAIAELSSHLEKLKSEVKDVRRERDKWKKACEDAGLEAKSDEDAGGDDEESDS